MELLPKYRLGVVLPRPDHPIVPYQFYKVLPQDVMLVSTAVLLEDYTRHHVELALTGYWECVDKLLHWKVDRIVQSGIPVGMFMGRAYMLDLIQETQKRTGVAADTDLEGVIAGMHHLGVKKVAVACPWSEQVNKPLTEYLADAGIQVVGQTTVVQTLAQARAMSLEEGMRLAIKLGREAMRLAPQADGLLLPGGAWLSLPAIPLLEEETGKPVFTNCNGIIWAAVRKTGVVPPIQGWGKLLAS